jgi:hypothetical protein
MREPIFIGLKSYTDISLSVIAHEDDGGVIRIGDFPSILPAFTF